MYIQIICHVFVRFVDIKWLLKKNISYINLPECHFNKATDYNTRIVSKVISRRQNPASTEGFNLTHTVPVLVWHSLFADALAWLDRLLKAWLILDTKTPQLSGFCFKNYLRIDILHKWTSSPHEQYTISSTHTQYYNHVMSHEN